MGQHRQTLSLSKASEYLSITDIKGANSFCDPSGPAVSPLAHTAPSRLTCPLVPRHLTLQTSPPTAAFPPPQGCCSCSAFCLVCLLGHRPTQTTCFNTEFGNFLP